jgi:malonyl-CoA/methylmalonyl-CoA synthetase
VIRDADAETVVVHPDFAAVMQAVHLPPATRTVTTDEAVGTALRSPLPVVAEERRAMIVYTSGTTGKPKGVVTTHANIAAQVTSLVTAWEWRADDWILLVLPLHHVHGIINVLTCALWAGARCEMLAKFEAEPVWTRIAARELTLFMAVPTIYGKLITAWEAAPPERRRAWSAGCASPRMRLMVSGSAALPVQRLERWREISGHVLLERYGMTEIGMALSNPLGGERRPGFVGTPLPGVAVRLVPGTGEIEVRGATVFLEYWRRPDATAAAFQDGWFRTGDVAVVEHGAYRILGRSSVDIIKTGGYKVSALEVEEVLRTHPAIAECAVVGVEDPEWGERICVAVERRGAADLTLAALQTWAKERLAPYKIPRALRSVPALPRNAMGKVTKGDVATLFHP